MTTMLRPRPSDIAQPADIPKITSGVQFLHPANGLYFLALDTYDYAPKIEPQAQYSFGIHHGTALLACQVIAHNEKGFLSSSKERNDQEAHAPQSFDEVLTSRFYYYHLENVPEDNPNPFYPICLDFDQWRFPHGDLHPSWKRSDDQVDDDPLPILKAWSKMSESVKVRDSRCRISHWMDAINTARVVPRKNEVWMEANRMHLYASSFAGPPNHDGGNLFALRTDLHHTFDQGIFTIAPKCGQMVVHFLQRSCESAILYHNVPFQDSSLSFEFLFARFAWSVIKIASELVPSERQRLFQEPASKRKGKDFKKDDGDGDESNEEGPSKKKRKVAEKKADVTGTRGTTRSGDKKAVKKDVPSMSSAPGQSNSDSKGTTADSEIDACELTQDLAKAKKALPFFVNPDEHAGQWQYDNLAWYPGVGIVERRKREYMEAHPNINAHSGETAEDEGSDYERSDSNFDMAC